MPTALPAYVGNDFKDCPPGHRFGLYFDGWTADYALPKDGKTKAFRKLTTLPAHSLTALKALRDRQHTLAADLGESLLTHPARLTAPLATGLGNEHPLENGFAFLNPHGLPYLAGSGVKGVLRRAAEELATGDWGDSAGWDRIAIDTLFGLETESGDNESARTRGALSFWDLFFQPPAKKDLLTVEIMTPHHRDYLQGSGTPHANEQPNPIPFLAIAPGCECTLYVQCNQALIPADAASLRENWKALIEAAIEHAGDWLGFGAKTAVGYGRLGQDEAIRKDVERAVHERAEAAQRAAHEAQLAQLSLQGRQIAEFATACDAKASNKRKDPFTPGSGLYADALRLSKTALAGDSTWSAADRLLLAETFAEWLPRVIEKLDRKDDWKDARKKLQLAALRGE